MKFALVVLLCVSLAVVVSAQSSLSRCRTTCTRQAQFTVDIDGVRTTARCSDGNNLVARCAGCCESWALSRGNSKSNMSGFVSSDGNTCVCCERAC
uniref:Uncharacterized protein n=1 Tax=Panagrolaimus sp. JU765 TaxID=591449 RepID=A0AC34QYA8_9BILA